MLMIVQDIHLAEFKIGTEILPFARMRANALLQRFGVPTKIPAPNSKKGLGPQPKLDLKNEDREKAEAVISGLDKTFQGFEGVGIKDSAEDLEGYLRAGLFYWDKEDYEKSREVF